MEGGDWRTQLRPAPRQRVVNKIMEILKRHLPFSGPEVLRELKEAAVRFEEKIYTAATSQEEYLRKITLEMLKIEPHSQNPAAKFLQSNGASNSRNPQYPGFSQVKVEWIAPGQAQIPGQVMGEEAVTNLGMKGGDWRTQLQPDSRQTTVNRIMENLKRNLPFSGPEGLQELKEAAVRFEEKVYTAATSREDYEIKILWEMLNMDSQSQNHIAKFLQSNGASNSRNPQYPGFSQVKVEGGDWSTQLQPDSRQRIVNKIMETLKKNLPLSGPEGLQELKKIAVRFEEKVYTTATGQKDYLRKISLKMLTMPNYQSPIANSLQSNGASNSRNPQYPGYLDVSLLSCLVSPY